MITTITQAVKFLEKYIPTASKKYPGELGLKRMQHLCKLSDNPQFAYPTIHVGGTSGKGSTSTIIASILATKYKVGLHTSPHLVRITERIKTNIKYQISNMNLNSLDMSRICHPELGSGSSYRNETPKRARHDNLLEDIPDGDFVNLINDIKPAIEVIERDKREVPSYFEIITAMAFVYFKQQNVDIAVIEVGMGGRFDATNVIRPEVAVLTNVGLDHTEILGDTVEKIAKDKVGIIKPGVQVVSGVKQPSVVEILISNIKCQMSKLSLLNNDFKYRVKSVTDRGSLFDYYGDTTMKNLKLNLLGEHQVENAALAIRAVEMLSKKWKTLPIPSPIRRGIKCEVNEGEIRNGLVNAYIPGRLEIIKRKPLVILDGAHNPDKMRALIQSMKTVFPKKKVTAIVAIKQDKNAKEILGILLPICWKIILTSYRIKADQGKITSYKPGDLLQIIRAVTKEIPADISNNPKRALEQAIISADKDDLILITGSLYLVGEICKKLEIS